MGLFGKLFEKKNCDICGNEIKLLGNRKLSDGNLCKDCANKLSPWFSERKQSTVEEIREQLEYREQNREAVAAFHVTRTLGRDTKVLIDEDAMKFMVTSAKNLTEANPDVLDISEVTGCDLDIQESRREEKRSVKKKDGTTEQVSFNPPHYVYSYNFRFIINVNNPYFNEISFRLNGSSVEIKTVGDIDGGVLRSAVRRADPRQSNPDYKEYQNMGNEIKRVLTKAHAQSRKQQIEAATKQAVVCPFCGATTMPDEGGRCEYCGGAIEG